MELDQAACYRAVCSRDPRFDGTFFTGVTTTGIYCRPVCPARTPHARNCIFFPSAAAAAAAGLRPCLRCRPETSPGSPAWQGTGAVVGRALRLIDEGALDGGGVENLAHRLGVGGRHLRRLFTEHLGASPREVGMTRRLDLARRLLVESDLEIGRIAVAAGFGSPRRFHGAATRAWGCPPSAIRAGRRGPAADPANGDLELRLAYRPPYSWEDQLRWLKPRAIPGVESVIDGTYRRTIAPGGTAGHLAVTADPGGDALRLRVSPGLIPELRRIVARVRAMFDLDADPAAIGSALGCDPLLGPLLERRPGLRLPGSWDPFETAVRAVLGQQISVGGATTLAGRLAAGWGGPVPGSEGAVLFPEPAALADAPLERCGVIRSRAEAIRTLARSVLAGELDLDAAADPVETSARLRALRGIGPWTAQYVALRGWSAPDVFPAGDLGLRKACAAGGPLPSEPAVRDLAARWSPWRSYAAVHLWASLGDAEPGA
ncbi:helix-turn-helix domain-containing protein [bacterium]|nr:helix-turn-helix domain-containing protein [bacterium]